MPSAHSLLAAVALAAGLLVPASVARAGEAGELTVPLPASWQYSAPSAPIVSAINNRWWSIFGDRDLDRLIERMHAGNTTLPQAVARLAAARAQARMDASSMVPNVGLDASASHASGPLINAAGGSGTLYTARATVSWEADLFGKASALRQASKLDASAAEALLADTRLLLEAETVQTSFHYRRLLREAQLADRRSQLLRESAQIAGRRADLGQISQSEAETATRRALTASELVSQISQERDEAGRALAYLIGESTAPGLDPDLPVANPQVPAGLPDAVLARRPDIAAAIDRMKAADKRLQSARRSWLPGITLTASGGTASSSLGDILSSASRDFGLGLLLSLPIFDGGRHKALVAGKKAEADLAAAQYRDSLLLALREVNDRLGATTQTRARSIMTDERLAFARSDERRAAQALANGTRSRLAVIDSELAAIDAEQASLSAQTNALVATVGLIKALGGGWDS